MKTIMITVIAMVLLTVPLAGTRYRYIDKTVPLYLSVKSLPDDEDDVISAGIRAALTKSGVKLVSKNEYIGLQKQYQADVKDNISRSGFAYAGKPAAERFRETFGRGEQSQKITLYYVFKDETDRSLSNLDSIGFTYFKLPPRTASDGTRRASFSVNLIGSTNSDSLVAFLITKL